ncbi:MAG: hypothetical protein EA397_12500 [Deltaproteobacteria bacterium]|nr:MAG: hypothetical protein EA397_12500 [Deltaproteobacteria bacterium]
MISPLSARLGLLAILLSGCQIFSSTGEVGHDDDVWADEEFSWSTSDSGEQRKERTPIRPEDLRPHLSVTGDEGAAPDRLVVTFGRAIFGSASVGESPPEGTEHVLDPPVQGRLQVLSPMSVAFHPAQGFEPETSYQFRLTQVATRDGVLDVPQGEGELQFDAPALAPLRLEPVEASSSAIKLDLVFSGPVDVATAQSQVVLSHSSLGQVSAKWGVQGDQPNRLTTTLTGPVTQSKGTFTATVRSGYRSLFTKATGSSGKVTASVDPTLPPVNVEHVHLVEGGSSFQIQVICDDEASKGYKRWTWNQELERSFRTSPRCLPTDDSVAERVQISPATPLTVVQTRSGFRVQGQLPRGAVKLTLGAGLETVDGGRLAETKTFDLDVPALSPSVSFSSSGRYLPTGAWRSLPVQHRNVEELTVRIRHVPERNLVFWLTGDSERAGARVADPIVEEVIPVRGAVDERVSTWLDLASMVPNPKPGVYEVEIDGAGSKDVRRLLQTDLNLVVKGSPIEGEGRLHVWALGMRDGAQQGAVDVSAILPSGKVIGSCLTGSSGCVLDFDRGPLGDQKPIALLARRGKDVTYLKFSDLETDLSEQKVQGEPFVSEVPYRASLWSERGVFRPGETAHVAGVVRDESHRAPPRGMPVDLEVRDTQGRVMRTEAVRLNGAGMFELAVPFADYARTGSYRVVALAGGKKLGEVGFGVEEFVPERMEVAAQVAGEGFLDTQPVPVRGEARYLFGGSAEDHNAELTCRLIPSAFRPEGHPGFSFGRPVADTRPIELGSVMGTLDADGKAELRCPTADASARPAGHARLVADFAVFESGSGRTTQRTVRVPIHSTEHYVGLQVAAARIEADKPFQVDGVVVDWEGRAVEGEREVEVELVKLETHWGHVFDAQQGRDRYQRIQRPVSLTKERVQAKNGRFSTTLTAPENSGSFRVVATDGAASSVVEVEGSQRWWWWGDDQRTADATPKPLKPSEVRLTVPERIEVGENAKVSYVAPFKGKLLLTVETDEVLRSEWVSVDAGPGEWSFTLAEFVDNVYVSGLLVKDPHLESREAFLPDRAFGVRSIRVAPTAYQGEIALSVPDEIRGGSELKVDLDLGPGRGARYVTVAAVDEGILSLTNFQTPDPTLELFPQRALGIRTWETIGWALHLPAADGSRSTGGDGDGGMPSRVQMVKPVSLWSGLVEVPESGKTSVSFEVPQYQGRLRVMAVSAGRERVAHADAQVTVADPVVVQTTVPRFLVQGDQAEVPVFLTNRSGVRREVTVSMAAEQLGQSGSALAERSLPPVRFEGAREATFTLEDGESRTAVFRFRTHLPAGAINLAVQAVSDDLTFTESLDVPVEPEGPRERRHQLLPLEAGEVSLTSAMTGWVPGSERSTVTVTNNPYGRAFAHLAYLVRYPHGCIEQTTSTTRPLLYVGNLLPSADPDLAASKDLDAMLKHGIDRILSMQTPSGGFAYWQGQSQPTAWGTAYATHLLLDAQKAGYPVPERKLDEAVSWLRKAVRSNSDVRDFHSGTPGGAAYAHYVLARGGQGDVAAMQAELAKLSGDSGPVREATYLLQAGLYHAGDRRYESELRQPDTSAITKKRVNDWSFYSDLRRRAFMLSIYADLFGSEGADPLARLVADGLSVGRPSRSFTTQELAWGTSGLGKIVSDGARDFDVTLKAGGREIPRDAWGSGSPSDALIWSLIRASEVSDLSLSVSKTGSGKLYALVQSEGVREDAVWTFGGDGLSVRRSYSALDGRAVNLDDVQVGDLLLARVTLKNTTGSRVQNLALVDRVPAGFEIENPRLGRSGGSDQVDRQKVWSKDHLSVRDDRVEVFGALDAGQEVEVVYTVRAVTAGTFTLPPTEVEAMYDPSLWARAPGGRVRVFGPWAGSYL